MDKVQQGTLDALSVLFERYQGPVYGYLVRQCRDREVAADLCQSVFERVIKYRSSYRLGQCFKAWVYQIARNLQKDHWAKNKLLMSDYTDMEQIDRAYSGSVEQAEKHEQNSALYEVMERLSPERRELLQLSRFEGLKYEEISEMTGMSVAAIKVNIHRAIKQLRSLYFATS